MQAVRLTKPAQQLLGACQQGQQGQGYADRQTIQIGRKVNTMTDTLKTLGDTEIKVKMSMEMMELCITENLMQQLGNITQSIESM